MQAHLEMGEKNIRYEDVKAAGDENGRSVTETLDIMGRTVAKDKEGHAEEYAPRSESRRIILAQSCQELIGSSSSSSSSTTT